MLARPSPGSMDLDSALTGTPRVNPSQQVWVDPGPCGRMDSAHNSPTNNAQAATEAAEELRGRIEILMDEIEISLGMEPAAIEDIEGLELDLPPEDPAPRGCRGRRTVTDRTPWLRTCTARPGHRGPLAAA